MGKEGDGDEGRVYAGTEQDRGDLRALVFIVASGSQAPRASEGMSAVCPVDRGIFT